MDDIMKGSKVTLDQGNQLTITDQSVLSTEERDFYKLMFGDDIAAVRHRRLHCTACDNHIGSAPAKAHNMFTHPVLLTLLCADCRNFYGDGNFEQGEDATDMFCRWCANGGNLYCCSYCSNTFCNKCIKRNFDPLVRKKIEDEEKWKCFVCDPADLYTARSVCWALLQHVQTVTRILKNDCTISKEEFKEKMNLDESKCCLRKRKAKRQKLSFHESEEEDETYHPAVEDMSRILRRKVSRSSPRTSIPNGEEEKSVSSTQSLVKSKSEVGEFNEEDDDEDLPLPMIPCVQYMVEGDSSETLNDTINSQSNIPQVSSSRDCDATPIPPILQINPIPTANLLKVVPPSLTPIRNNFVKRKRTRPLQHILPALGNNFVMVKNTSSPNCPTPGIHTVEYSSLPLRAPSVQPGVPIAKTSPLQNSPSPSVHNIEYSSLPLRTPSIQPGAAMITIPATTSTYIQPSRMSLQKPKPGSATSSTPIKEVGVIEINSDSDEPEIEESNDDDPSKRSVCSSRDILKHMLSKGLRDNSKFPESCFKKKGERANNKVEEEIDLRSEEVRMLFKMIGTKLKKVPLLHLPNHNNLRSTRVKTRRFHHAITKAIAALSDINDKVVHKYSSWRKSMLEESRQTRSSNNTHSAATTTTNDIDIPLDMICTNSGSESDNNDESDSDGMLITEKIKSVKSFQERDTIDIGVGDPISTADKSVQVFDAVDRDYEKCIGHSVLTKIEYNPTDGSEILKPVIVPAEYDGKFEEQFIFYLQYREEHEVRTDDDKGLPDPNETPLKDLIEANSPFVLEMLESIDSPLANGMITSELGTETSNESGKENEDQSESTNVVKELAKMVTELSEDLKTTRNNETLAKKHSEYSKKDRRKQVLENVESEEVDIAVQTLIEEDELSRSSSNDDNAVSCHVKKLTIEGKGSALCYSEDECTIID